MKGVLKFAGIAALVLFTASLLGFAGSLEGYDQRVHPVALLGATGIPHALAFNLCAFVLPGLLAAMVAVGLRNRLPQGGHWWARIGVQLLLLSAMGFIAMGMLPLDPTDLESDASRLHGTAWMAWSVAFIAGGLLSGIGLMRIEGVARLAWAALAAAAIVWLSGFAAGDWLPPGLPQRIALLAWLGWYAIAGRVAACGAVPAARG